MDFNIDKCKVMNIGRENPHNNIQYKQGNAE